MAVRESASNNGGRNRRAWFVAACLLVLFVAALFLRAYWNLEAAHPDATTFVLSGGSDPYYHKRAADAIQATGFRHHLVDPLLNYPRGSENPNPPVYEWMIAGGGQMLAPMFGGDVAKATWEVAIWSPAVLGALTVFPIYFIGAALFDRRVGLVAALLWVVSTSAIDAGGVGLADHDSAVLLFATLAFLFYIQTIRSFRGEANWIAKWGDGSAISRGFGNLFRERGTGFGYALLTAVSIAAVALTWKGFNYVIGIIFVFAVIQMVVDHWRNRDSTGLFLATLLAMAGGVLLALPYYRTANVGNFLQPTWYILVTFLLLGLVLVPTRDLPTILVLPIAGLAAFLLLAAAFFVFPEVSQSLLYATVYFKQTRLYETIAEAHPADFSTMAFGIGPLAFFLAIFGWIVVLFKIHETTLAAWTRLGIGIGLIALGAILAALIRLIPGGAAEPIGLMALGLGVMSGLAVMLGGATPQARTWGFAILWGIVAVFMAQSAVRFLINAIPVFAVFAGFMTIWILDWLDFGAIRKSLAANRGNSWQGLRKGTRPLHIVAVILIALLFVFPTTILAADAALPPEAEDKLARDTNSDFARTFYTERLGAYGGGFSSVEPWIPPLTWLDQHDANTTDLAKRPAFLAWWDYGHWAIAIGKHPTVADNFQNGYEFAANFILSQDEASSIQLIAARLAEAPGADLEKALTDAGSANPSADAASIRAWQKAGNLTVEQSAKVVAALEAQTGKSIRYFATDIRMLPYDNPQTTSIDQGSIFYAPVKLKGDQPDDYVTTQVNMGQPVAGAPDGYVTTSQYEQFARDPIHRTSALGERLSFQQKFFNSMFWRSYVGTNVQSQDGGAVLGTDVESALNNPRPAAGLEHFRAVYVGAIQRMYKGGDPADARSYLYYPGILIVEYYPGAIVTGTVTEDGAPVSGATVTAYDDAGSLLATAFQSGVDPGDFHVPHTQTTTAADGTYSIRVPFALENGSVTLDASRGGVSIGTTQIAVTREQSNAQESISNVGISVQHGVVEGLAFVDDDGNGAYNATSERPAGNVNLTIGSVTVMTDADGRYRAESVSAGLQNITVDSTDLQVGATTNRVRVQPGTNVTQDVALEPRAARVTGQLVADLNGDGTATPDEGVEFQTVSFTADTNATGNTARTVTAFTETGGNFTIQLRPGTYVLTSTYTDSASGNVYRLEQALTVAPGQQIADQKLEMAKQ